MRSPFYCRIVLFYCVLLGGLSLEFNHVIYCNDDDDDDSYDNNDNGNDTNVDN